MSFLTAFNAWLHFLRTGDRAVADFDDAAVATTKDVVVEFMLRREYGNRLHSLADSGFGFSQVLPILARGLLTPIGHTVVIEQPEVHLNPGLNRCRRAGL